MRLRLIITNKKEKTKNSTAVKPTWNRKQIYKIAQFVASRFLELKRSFNSIIAISQHFKKQT